MQNKFNLPQPRQIVVLLLDTGFFASWTIDVGRPDLSIKFDPCDKSLTPISLFSQSMLPRMGGTLP